jgi:hypothetical protein
VSSLVLILRIFLEHLEVTTYLVYIHKFVDVYCTRWFKNDRDKL